MENKKWTRRQVLGSLAVLPLATNTGLLSVSNILQVSLKATRCKLLNSNGEPFDLNKMGRFYICDLMSRPFQIDPQFAPGEIVFIPAGEKHWHGATPDTGVAYIQIQAGESQTTQYEQ